MAGSACDQSADEGRLVRRSPCCAQGDRKTRAVCNRHDLATFAPLIGGAEAAIHKALVQNIQKMVTIGVFLPLIRCERSRSGAISDKGNITQGYQKLADWNADSFSTEGSPKQPRREVAHTDPPPEPRGFGLVGSASTPAIAEAYGGRWNVGLHFANPTYSLMRNPTCEAASRP